MDGKDYTLSDTIRQRRERNAIVNIFTDSDNEQMSVQYG